MRKHLFGVLSAGVALSLVVGGQSAAEPSPQVSQPDPMLAFLPVEAQVDWAAVHRNREIKSIIFPVRLSFKINYERSIKTTHIYKRF